MAFFTEYSCRCCIGETVRGDMLSSRQKRNSSPRRRRAGPRPKAGSLNDAIIGAGSNIHADRSIREARKILTETFTLTAESGPLMTEPVGGRPQPFFMNAVYRIRTPLGRTELDRMLKRVESRMGRIRTADRYAPRIMDLDILVWNGKIVHPDVFERKFLRKLLREIGFTVDSRPDLL